MREEVFDLVEYVVNAFGLHGRTHVDLDPLSQHFTMRKEDLRPYRIAGYCTLPEGDRITEDDPVKIILDRHLNERDVRLVYAHEIGHGLTWNAGELAMGSIDQWFVNKAEREAWEVASVLLVPFDAIAVYQELSRIALVCDVPEQMVEIAMKCYRGV